MAMWKRVPANLDNVKAIRDDKAARLLTWPSFPKGLFCDMNTANALLVCYDALTDANKATFVDKLAKGPGEFLLLARFAWRNVKAAA